jgi:hypothetical protein
MAYLFDPHVTECTVTISVNCHDAKCLTETHRFTEATHGREVVNQIADTVLSALHLAQAVAPPAREQT